MNTFRLGQLITGPNEAAFKLAEEICANVSRAIVRLKFRIDTLLRVSCLPRTVERYIMQGAACRACAEESYKSKARAD